MLGKHPVFAASSTQTILSLSSGEAEFCGAVRYACRTLGLKSLMSDLSLEVKAELVTDSSACKELCSRRGAGKIRHIHCRALWLQHAVARRQIAITRRAGKHLAPDVGTKAGIPEDTMWRLLGTFGLAKGEGRAKQALNMAGRQAEASEDMATLRLYDPEWIAILNEVHSSHVLSTKLCSDCVGYPFVIIAVLHQRSACWSLHAFLIWVCVFIHSVFVRALMIVPENRVALAPCD